MLDPVVEKKAFQLFEKIRCTTCEFQSITDSPAPLAADMRSFIVDAFQSGQSEEQVIEFIVARYGEAIYLDPGFSTWTLFLWSVPLLLFFGLLLWYKIFQRR